MTQFPHDQFDNSIDLINNLSLESIEFLGDTLLDFNTADDLTTWLAKSLWDTISE